MEYIAIILAFIIGYLTGDDKARQRVINQTKQLKNATPAIKARHYKIIKKNNQPETEEEKKARQNKQSIQNNE